MHKNLICYLRSIFPFISQLQKLKHDKYWKKVMKCNKPNLNIFTEPNLFIQHHEKNWEENFGRMAVNGILKETSQQTSELGRCYVVVPITGQLCLRLGRAVVVVLLVIVMLVIKVMMFMTCLIFCSESSMITSCFISLFSCQYESKI